MYQLKISQATRRKLGSQTVSVSTAGSCVLSNSVLLERPGYPKASTTDSCSLLHAQELRCNLFQMLAVLAMYGKIPARLKVRNLFDLFDLDSDGNLNSFETILMLRFVGDNATSCLLAMGYNTTG